MAADSLNVLFIMTDQMRADCLSCAGHPVVRTPNLDALAAQGVRFTNAFVQSAVCGPSRMCFYTGRYMHATRSPWNDVPLPADERTMGHYFAEAGYRAALCGKTHYVADPLDSLPDHETDQIQRVTLAGLEEYELNDARGEGWLRYLKEKGYPDAVIAYPFDVDEPDDPGGRDRSAFPTRVRREDSDTAYMTGRAIEFMEETGDRPWFLHLSYFKPPSADRRTGALPCDVAIRTRSRNRIDHRPSSRMHTRSTSSCRIERRSGDFDHESVWRQRLATYYGLITEIDDQLGRAVRPAMTDRGLWEKTLICFTSDHGEYVGDHWMFEKELFV